MAWRSSKPLSKPRTGAESRGKAEGRNNDSRESEKAAPSDSELEISSRLAGKLNASDPLQPGAAGPLAESLAEAIAGNPDAARDAQADLSGERVAQILGRKGAEFLTLIAFSLIRPD